MRVWKQKGTMRSPHWDWAPRGSMVVAYGDSGYWGYRWFRDRHKWDSVRGIDAVESKDWGFSCTLRPRGGFPSLYDDLKRSRNFYVKSWKDKTKRRKQWER